MSIRDFRDACQESLNKVSPNEAQAALSFGRLVDAIAAGMSRGQWVDELRLWSLAFRICRSQQLGTIGALVECGVARGSSASVLAWASQEFGRVVWLFDTFAGLPPAGPVDERLAGQSLTEYTGRCLGDLADVRAYLKASWPRAKLQFRPGLFEDVLPLEAPAIGAIALLHADGDWYQSTADILANLGRLVVPGGSIVFDDYGHWAGCRQAVDEWLGVVGNACGSVEPVGITQAVLTVVRSLVNVLP